MIRLPLTHVNTAIIMRQGYGFNNFDNLKLRLLAAFDDWKNLSHDQQKSHRIYSLIICQVGKSRV